MTPADIYGGTSPIDLAAYSPAAAAHHLALPQTTVRYWVLGREHQAPVIRAADAPHKMLSFRNLVELHVLSAVTRSHAIPLPKVRRAVEWLRREFSSQHPLSDERMTTDGKDLFVERLGVIFNASAHGQIAPAALVGMYLQRISRDPKGVPVRLFPFTRKAATGPDTVVIDPRVQFGRPCLAGTGVPTTLLVERFKAGDSIADLAEDYRRKSSDIEEAIRYETELKAA